MPKIEAKNLEKIMTNEKHLSHKQSRPFQPTKLSKPRNFVIPEILTNKQKSSPPIVIEIGAGKGMHALSFAKQNPDKHLIAIERTRNKFEAFSKIAKTQQLANLTPVHADAIAWIVQAIAPNSISQIYLLYPKQVKMNHKKPPLKGGQKSGLFLYYKNGLTSLSESV